MIGILFFLITVQGERSSLMFVFVQSLNVLLCLFFINERPGFNLVTSFYGFSIIILGILPIAEFKFQIIYWSGKYLSEEIYIQTSFLVMLSIIAFRFGYNKRKNLNQLKTPSTISDLDKNKLELKLTNRTILFLIAPCLFLLAQFEYDFIALQFRGLGEQLENVFLFELFFLKPFIFNIFFFYILILKKSSKKHTFKKLVFLFGLLFFTGPLSVPRFLSFCLFVPFIYLYFNFRRNNSYLFINIVFFGLIFIFPILDIFRWFTLENKLDLAQNFNIEYFFAGHFDAFQNFARVIEFDFHTYGYQMLGALFFFIPRSIWVTKPVGSGFLLAEEAGLHFNNISVPFVAELYLDYSYFGIIIGIFLLGLIYRKIDDVFNIIININSFTTILKLIAFSEFCCLQFYLLRGNLLGAFAFSSSIILTVFVIYIYYLLVNKSLKKTLWN